MIQITLKIYTLKIVKKKWFYVRLLEYIDYNKFDLLKSKPTEFCIIKNIKLFRLKTKRNSFWKNDEVQFSYCSLIWMSSSRKSNNLINKEQERSLRKVRGDNDSSFKSLLSTCEEITIHQRNLQVLMTEAYKNVNGISPPVTKMLSYYQTIRRNWRNVRIFKRISNENRKTVK